MAEALFCNQGVWVRFLHRAPGINYSKTIASIAVLTQIRGGFITTIAFDGKTIATDTQVTAGTLKFGYQDKITKLKDGRLLASAGDICLIPAVVTWLNGGDKPIIPENCHFLGLIIDKKKKEVLEVSPELLIFPACVPWAGGSGEQIAFTAMKCGKTASEAVQLAIELDIYTGGEVRTVII